MNYFKLFLNGIFALDVELVLESQSTLVHWDINQSIKNDILKLIKEFLVKISASGATFAAQY
jgi:predicted RNase H-related nuclease YkuK (DUF458 family)